MFNLLILQYRQMKDFSNSLEEDNGPITSKEKFALIWLIAGGLIIGLFFAMFIYIFATTYEFREFSISFGPVG